jgi:hypothetical protein
MKSNLLGISNFRIFQAEFGDSEKKISTVIKISNIAGDGEFFLSAGCDEFEVTKDDLFEFVDKLKAYLQEN